MYFACGLTTTFRYFEAARGASKPVVQRLLAGSTGMFVESGKLSKAALATEVEPLIGMDCMMLHLEKRDKSIQSQYVWHAFMLQAARGREGATELLDGLFIRDTRKLVSQQRKWCVGCMYSDLTCMPCSSPLHLSTDIHNIAYTFPTCS